ncbi:hypothetical protein [Maribacter spongiicola]|uniref:hypothetical protein n=1 Tax=Maribacter spongiicola TaxID=1206753 RepID=UPI003F9D67C2
MMPSFTKFSEVVNLLTEITPFNFYDKINEIAQHHIFVKEKLHLQIIALYINDDKIYQDRIEKFLKPKFKEFDIYGDFDELDIVLMLLSLELYYFFDLLSVLEKKQLVIKCLDILNINDCREELSSNYNKVQELFSNYRAFYYNEIFDKIPDNLKKLEATNEIIDFLNRTGALKMSLDIPSSKSFENLKKFSKSKKEFYRDTHFINKKQKRSFTEEPDNCYTYKDYTNIFQKSMPIDVAVSHFKKLTENNSKNGRPFLTKEQLDVFIRKAFCGVQDLPKQKFNQAPKGEKSIIQHVFREFYDANWDYFGTGQVQDKFIKLLTENFTDWDYKNVRNNFSKSPKKTI